MNKFNIFKTNFNSSLKRKQDIYSFLTPIVQSFKALQYGVKLYDRFRNESFIYKAHITHILGDTPAISKMMGIKGVNSEFPCRNCKIQCQRGPSNILYPHCIHQTNMRHTMSHIIRFVFHFGKATTSKSLPTQ